MSALIKYKITYNHFNPRNLAPFVPGNAMNRGVLKTINT